MTDTASTLPEIIDRCVEELAAGSATVEDCLEHWPQHRAELEPLLRAATALSELPVEQVEVDPARRALLMAQIRQTPQQRPGLRLPALRPFGFGLSSLGFGGWAFRAVAVSAPAVVIAVFALVLVTAGGPASASAATLTVFSGQVERQVDGAWLPLADGTSIEEGVTIRTGQDGLALITFPDGSTASVDASTQLSFQRISLNGRRAIEIAQANGRIWNDVVPISGSDSYVIRTPHAVVQAAGTVFETLVDAETSVLTAQGLVHLSSGERTVDVAPGQRASAGFDRIDAPTDVAFVGEIRIRAPMAAYLISPGGAATGVLPNGLVFRQVPGVTTTAVDPTEGDGAAYQRMLVGAVEPGTYSLILRRFAPGDGVVLIETPGDSLSVTVAGEVEAARVELGVDLVDGTVRMVALGTELQVVEQPPQVRFVETPRSRSAVSLADYRPAPTGPGEARPAATAQVQRQPERPDGTATPAATREATTRPAAEPTTAATRATPTVDASDPWVQLLTMALAGDDDETLARVLEQTLAGGADSDGARLLALTDAMADSDARDWIVELYAAGQLPAFAAEVEEAVRLLDPAIAAVLLERFQSATDADSGSGSRGAERGARHGAPGAATAALAMIVASPAVVSVDRAERLALARWLAEDEEAGPEDDETEHRQGPRPRPHRPTPGASTGSWDGERRS